MESTWTKQYIVSINKIVRQTLKAMIANHPHFEDLEQEAMMRIFAKRDRIPTGASHNSYIRSIAKNCGVDFLRRTCRTKNQAHEVPLYSPRQNDEADWLVNELSVSYSEEMSDPFLMEMVLEAIAQLSPQHRTILMLKVHDVEYKEMSRILNISEGTVRSRLHYAKNICAKNLRPKLA